MEHELTHLYLPADVEERSLQILEHIRKVYPNALYVSSTGARKRCECLFAVYHAHRELGRVCVDNELALALEVVPDEPKVRSKIKAILKTYYRLGYPPPLVVYAPRDYVPRLCEFANLPLNEQPRVVALIDRVLVRFPDLGDVSPGIVAAGVIHCYMSLILGRQVDQAALLEHAGLPRQHTPIVARVSTKTRETYMG